MSNIFLLYKTEIRKILAKKSVWAAMAVSIVLVLLTGLANLSADGHSAYVKEQETRLTALSGSPMDDAFLESFKAGGIRSGRSVSECCRADRESGTV